MTSTAVRAQARTIHWWTCCSSPDDGEPPRVSRRLWCALRFARSACLISGGGGVAERVFSDSEQSREKPRDLAPRDGGHK